MSRIDGAFTWGMPGQLASSHVFFVLDGWMRTKILLYILHLQFAVYDTILSL